MHYFLDALKQYAVFRGRTRRRGYWLFHLIYLVLFALMAAVDHLIGTPLFVYLLAAVLAIPSLAVSTRRLHDSGRSGWWQLVTLIPIAGFITLVFLLVQPSDSENAYGPSPISA